MSGPRHYMLIDDEAIKADTLDQWIGWYQGADTRIAKTETEFCSILTVFLGLDHSHSDSSQPDHVPILYETIVFRRDEPEVHHGEAIEIVRYATRARAARGHRAMVRHMRQREAAAIAACYKAHDEAKGKPLQD